jgi:DNA repair exonuclease SbcCD ATPase subunit
MNTTSKPEGQLTKAAAEFERELENYEKLSLELSRTPVRSEKSLSRARKLLTETNESEAELGKRLEGLSVAMRAARETQQACMDRIVEATSAAQRRAEEFAKLIERVALLGQKAHEVNEPVSRVLAAQAQDQDFSAMVTSLADVDAHMQSVVGDAEAVLSAAEDGDWPEVARDVRSLQQQVQSVRAKVKQAYQDLSASKA